MIGRVMRTNRMQVKICGMTCVEDVAVAVEAGADYLGLIRATSRRAAPTEQLVALASAAQPAATAVLLYVDAPLDVIVREVAMSGARGVQLHGHEPPEMLAELRREAPELTLIKALPVDGSLATEEYAAAAKPYAGLADVVLVDAPKGGEHPGAAILLAVAQAVVQLGQFRVWMAGGLTPEKLAEVVPNGTVHGVDVARGVETEPGKKSPDAVRAFIDTARSISPADFAGSSKFP